MLVSNKKKGLLLFLPIWRKILFVKHAYLLFKQVAAIKQVIKGCLVKHAFLLF